MQRMSDSRQPNPTAYADELMGVLSRTDVHTAKAALQIAGVLNDYRGAWQVSEALAQLQREFSDEGQTTSERDAVSV